MDIKEKIQLAFDDIDGDRLELIARTCSELIIPLQIDLSFRKNDASKLKIIHHKQKEAQEKIKEMGIKANYAVDLYKQHQEIEWRKLEIGQATNLPADTENTSIFKVELLPLLNPEDEYDGVDHLQCALTNAQKACEASVVWTILYSELEDLEMEVMNEMSLDNKKELEDHTIREVSGNDALIGKGKSQYQHDCQRIFKEDKQGRKVFEYLQANLVGKKNHLADYTFVFRRMQRDGFIYEDIKEKVFRDFLSRHFEVEIEYKLKPEGYNITDSKERIYSNAIHSLKAGNR